MKYFVFIALLLLNFILYCNAMPNKKFGSRENDDDYKERRRSLGSLFGSLFGSNDDEYKELPDVDWSKVKFKTIKLDTKEIEFTQKKLFETVEECVKRCVSKLEDNKKQKQALFQWSWRDKCIQSECDIY